LAPDDITTLLENVARRANEVPDSIMRVADAARAARIPTFSHDDRNPEERRWYRALGCTVSEFPQTVATAEEAVAAGEATVFGAPNVLRGGSHIGCPSAQEMVERGLCKVLASDYYYPALLLAPFRLARDFGVSLADVWQLVSSGPAAAVNLKDRGEIAEGLRGDVILVDAERAVPRVVATIVGGRIVHLTEPDRLCA
jgi:alpha-D-ribose 1-methylphosphonate 5-triphosphate diphosphatase